MPEDDPLSETGIGHKRLKKEFGENWRSWKWFADQWSKTSLATIGGLLLAFGGVLAWAWNLNTHVTILETRVMPVLKEGKQESENATRIEAIDKRVGRIEGVFDVGYAEDLKTWAEAVRYARAHGLPTPPPPTKGSSKR